VPVEVQGTLRRKPGHEPMLPYVWTEISDERISHEAENNLIEIMGNLKAEYKTDS